jgi:hypothetical protein
MPDVSKKNKEGANFLTLINEIMNFLGCRLHDREEGEFKCRWIFGVNEIFSIEVKIKKGRPICVDDIKDCDGC